MRNSFSFTSVIFPFSNNLIILDFNCVITFQIVSDFSGAPLRRLQISLADGSFLNGCSFNQSRTYGNESVSNIGPLPVFAFLQLLYCKYSNENENKESISYNYDTTEQNNIDQNNNIDNWLRDAIPLKLIYDLFRTLYFNDNGKENTKTVNLKILNGLNKIIEKKYPLFYNDFNDKLKENIELTKIIGQNRKEYIKAINKMDEFFDNAERENIILNENKKKSSKYELPSIIDNRAYARMLPKDWQYQILQLAKEGSNDKQK